MAVFQKLEINQQFLDDHPSSYFVFEEDLQHQGKTKITFLQNHPLTFGFIVQKFSDNLDNSFYRPEEYVPVFFEELEKLRKKVESEPEKTFYIPRLGSGSANKFFIWEKIVKHFLTHTFKKHSNVIFCWD